jgi:hypothetical protein
MKTNGEKVPIPPQESAPGAAAQRRWSYALVQHPMWLLIAEDSVCAERTPPWGCPTIEQYAERLAKSLDAVEQFPELHINFDFSAVELEDLAKRCPELASRLRRLVTEGRISFVNGTYSQPHLHILSLESIIRQFEYGLKAIRDITGYEVTCYASQEPGFSQLLPQVLRAFGYQTATTPAFPFGMHIMKGVLQHWSGRWGWVHGNDIVDWESLDGTTIPVWLRNSGCPDESTIADDVQRGLLHPTRLKVDLPDMIEVDKAWIERVSRYSHMVRLDQALAEMVARCHKPPRARFDANYAYVEGVDVEELSRSNTQVENLVLRYEKLQAFLRVEGDSFPVDEAWRTLLAAQHHDAYWTGAPELRAKCIAQLEELKSKIEAATLELAQKLGRELPSTPNGRQALLVLFPGEQQTSHTIEIDLPEECLVIEDQAGRPVAFQKRRLKDGSVKAALTCTSPGIGYTTLFLRPGSEGLVRRSQFRQSGTLESDFVRVQTLPDGTITSIRTDGRNLLKGPSNFWCYTANDAQITPTPIENMQFVERGPVYDAAQTTSHLNSIEMETRVTLLKSERVIWVDTKLHFPEPTEIGDYFDDTTKLQATWQFDKDALIRYVSGGCVEYATPGKPFIAYPLVDVTTYAGSFTIKFDRATKCWFDESGILHCVIAWGHNGDRFHNRQGPLPGVMGPLNWLKPMDLRLKGTHHIRQKLFINRKTLYDAELLHFATADSSEPVAAAVETGAGKLPWCNVFYHGHPNCFVTLSARKTAEGTVLRLLNTSSTSSAFTLKKGERWKVERAKLLDGKRVGLSAVPPWKIIEVLLVSSPKE